MSKAILSIQSHVSYGYVGNKAAVFPLQTLGFDVWQVNTVQFSNHTGYGKFKGDIFSKDHISQVIAGIKEIANIANCQAVLSGYIGSNEIGTVITDTVNDFKNLNPNIIYLCDPVMGDVGRGIFVKDEVVNYFKTNLNADIITPNHFEAELLSGIKITTLNDAKKSAIFFHELGVKIVIITSICCDELDKNKIHVFLSDRENFYVTTSTMYNFDIPRNGTGDLFSALFLGHYLNNKMNAYKALNYSLNHMDQVMKLTFDIQTRELQIINVDYTIATNLPNVTCLKV